MLLALTIFRLQFPLFGMEFVTTDADTDFTDYTFSDVYRKIARLFRGKIRKWQNSKETRGADCVDSCSQARISQDSNWYSKTAPVLVRISSNRRIRLSPAF